MNLLRDPIWQFISVVVSLVAILVAILIVLVNPLIAGIVFVASLIALMLLYPKLRPTKTIFFRVISDTTVLSIQGEEEVKREVKVLYKGQEVVEDIHLIILRLWNVSSEPILPEEYKAPIKMSFGKEAKILSALIEESNPPTIKEEISEKKLLHIDEGNVVLQPIWLNKDNSLTSKILLTKFQGEVSTDETRIIVGGYVRNWNKSGYNKIKMIIEKYDLITTISALISAIISLSILSYVYDNNMKLVREHDWIALIILASYVILAIILFLPLHHILKNGQIRLLSKGIYLQTTLIFRKQFIHKLSDFPMFPP